MSADQLLLKQIGPSLGFYIYLLLLYLKCSTNFVFLDDENTYGAFRSRKTEWHVTCSFDFCSVELNLLHYFPTEKSFTNFFVL